MNLHWHIAITQSSQFTEGSILGIARSAAMGECVMTGTYDYAIMHSSFTVPQILLASLIYPFPSPPTNPWQSFDLFCAHSFAFAFFHNIDRIIQYVV